MSWSNIVFRPSEIKNIRETTKLSVHREAGVAQFRRLAAERRILSPKRHVRRQRYLHLDKIQKPSSIHIIAHNLFRTKA